MQIATSLAAESTSKGWDWGVDLIVQLLKVGGEVVDALSIQKFPDDVRGLQVADGRHILSHGSIVVMLAVQVVGVPPLNLCTAATISLRTQAAAMDQIEQ